MRGLKFSLMADVAEDGIEEQFGLKFQEVKSIYLPMDDIMDLGLVTFSNALFVPSLRIRYVNGGVISPTVAQMPLTATSVFGV